MSDVDLTQGPWRWWNYKTLVQDGSNRPVVLTCSARAELRTFKEGGILEAFDPKSEVGRLIENSPVLRDALEEIMDQDVHAGMQNLFGEGYDTESVAAGIRLCQNIAQEALESLEVDEA